MTKRLILYRDPSVGPRTFGKLLVGNTEICKTLEPTNLMMKCGFYHCTPHGWPPNAEGFTKLNTWALNGEETSAQPEVDVDHAAVLFHSGNVIKDSRACILVGLTMGKLDGEMAVLSSVPAMDKMRKMIGNRDFYLTIRVDE